jgi:alcohol dehydrogenase class IV
MGPGQVTFEPKGLSTIGSIISSRGGKNVFVTTDKGIRDAGLLDGMVSSLDKEGLNFTIFDEVEPNPSVETVEKGFDLFKRTSCDFIVALGGGSPIDAGKAVGALSTNPPPIKQYEGAGKLRNAIVPLIAIPTTAGTGSEVTGASVITDRSRNYKMSVRSPFLIPDVAILDPTLLVSLPPKIIAETGMDALVHAVESYISVNSFPISEGLALEAISLVSENLRAFYAYPENIEAASNMLIASSMAGISFANARLGFIHAIAHALGGHYNIAHGLACALLLPHAMEYSWIANTRKFTKIAAAFGERIDGLTESQASRKAIDAVKALSRDIEIPKTLGELGVKADGITRVAQDAVESGIHLTTPRKIDQSRIESILHAAL